MALRSRGFQASAAKYTEHAELPPEPNAPLVKLPTDMLVVDAAAPKVWRVGNPIRCPADGQLISQSRYLFV